jgi:hypothetical protein
MYYAIVTWWHTLCRHNNVHYLHKLTVNSFYHSLVGPIFARARSHWLQIVPAGEVSTPLFRVITLIPGPLLPWGSMSRAYDNTRGKAIYIPTCLSNLLYQSMHVLFKIRYAYHVYVRRINLLSYFSWHFFTQLHGIVNNNLGLLGFSLGVLGPWKSTRFKNRWSYVLPCLYGQVAVTHLFLCLSMILYSSSCVGIMPCAQIGQHD